MSLTDVFIVGGGPAGLAAALAIRAKGLDVTVADAANPSIDKACGEGLMPDSLLALHSLGVTIPASEGFPFRGIRFLESGMSFCADFPDGKGIGLRRQILHRALVRASASAGANLMWGANVSGISSEGVIVNRAPVRARWIIGADGIHSRVRAWAGLNSPTRLRRRFGFRQHYRIEPWTHFMEIYWSTSAQIYVTPVATDTVCVALISRDPHGRIEDALPRFPEIASRLERAAVVTSERGAITGTRWLHAVHRKNVVLIGDASGSVDAITGEGLCLAFQQAIALANALDRDDLSIYTAAHNRIARKPGFMATLMLALDGRPALRTAIFRALTANPGIFRDMLAMHVGDLRASAIWSSGVALTRQILAGGSARIAGRKT